MDRKVRRVFPSWKANADLRGCLRATLDVIGIAGFGYAFDSLKTEENELATAFKT